jgi:hypothetical protein
MNCCGTEREGMHKKPIHGGIIDSDHGNRRGNAWCIPGNGDSKIEVHFGAAQDMDLFLHALPLIQTFMRGRG